MFPLFFSWARGIGIKFVLSLCRGGKVSPRKSVVQSACQYDVTSRVSNFQNGEETDKKFDFIKEILFRFLGFADFKVLIVIEN